MALIRRKNKGQEEIKEQAFNELKEFNKRKLEYRNSSIRDLEYLLLTDIPQRDKQHINELIHAWKR